jgi:hypothetical protein
MEYKNHRGGTSFPDPSVTYMYKLDDDLSVYLGMTLTWLAAFRTRARVLVEGQIALGCPTVFDIVGLGGLRRQGLCRRCVGDHEG